MSWYQPSDLLSWHFQIWGSVIQTKGLIAQPDPRWEQGLLWLPLTEVGRCQQPALRRPGNSAFSDNPTGKTTWTLVNGQLLKLMFLPWNKSFQDPVSYSKECCYGCREPVRADRPLQLLSCIYWAGSHLCPRCFCLAAFVFLVFLRIIVGIMRNGTCPKVVLMRLKRVLALRF